MSTLSDDGFWESIDGLWAPTEKQLQALEQGATPYNPESDIANQVEQVPVISEPPPALDTTNYQHKIQSSKFGISKKKLIFGTVTLVLIVTMIVLLSTLSPGTISMLDKIRDSDGDGITDYDELEMGTSPELRDSDNDNLDDGEDDCPAGQTNWDSKDTAFDFDGDGCKDDSEDTDDDNDGVSDLTDQCITADFDLSSDNDNDGCDDSDEDNDDDNDGVLDFDDDLPFDALESVDTDSDRIGDNADMDDDNDGVEDDFDDCPRGLSGWRSTSYTDNDGDGCKDSSEDDDDDNDGVVDDFDLFPFDENEQYDFDGDGIGDNSDDDDDNDGIVDILDNNDYADVGIKITIDYFQVFTQMDFLDTYTEFYICVDIDNITLGCAPSSETGNYWSLETNTTYLIDYEFSVDLDDSQASYRISFSAWDEDAFEDDRIDISPNPEYDSYFFDLFISNGLIHNDRKWVTVSGLNDGVGWDGALTFSVDLYDWRSQKSSLFEWTYDETEFNMNLVLEYDTYSFFKNSDHNVSGGIYNIENYAKFSTPHEDYVINLASNLKNMAIENGYTTDAEIAEFIYAFVGAIEYQFDIDGMGEADYAKYPIEMLWHQAGDCEDAAALYISLVEAIGFDAMLMVGLVKTSADDDWGGHAWAVVHISGHSGDGWYGIGSKSDKLFYFVETTAYYDGSEIGRNPWYDISETSIYDVE